MDAMVQGQSFDDYCAEDHHDTEVFEKRMLFGLNINVYICPSSRDLTILKHGRVIIYHLQICGVALHEALNVATAFNWMAVIESMTCPLMLISSKFSTHVPMYVPIVALKHDWDWTILSERMCMKDVVAYHEVHAPLQWDILSVIFLCQTY
jgi:hypothetical protein